MSTASDSTHSLRPPPLEVLFEARGLPEYELPAELARIYGGELGFVRPRLYANFVATLDGVVAIPFLPDASHAVATVSQHVCFLTGLLRACADAVLIGAGTLLRASPQTRWTAEEAYPPAASFYAQLRRLRGLPPLPTLAVLSGSGRIGAQHLGLRKRTLVLTSLKAATELSERLPHSARIVPLGEQPQLDPLTAIEALRADGHELILCEGGPNLFGALVRDGLVDELFLTLAPALAGRPPGELRLSLLENVALLRQTTGTLLSLRRGGSHLFLRYQLPAADDRGSDGR